MTLTQNSILDEILEKANQIANSSITLKLTIAEFTRVFEPHYDKDFFSLVIARRAFKRAEIETEKAIKSIQIARGY